MKPNEFSHKLAWVDYAEELEKQIKELKEQRNTQVLINVKQTEQIKELKELLIQVDQYCYLGDLSYEIKQALKK